MKSEFCPVLYLPFTFASNLPQRGTGRASRPTANCEPRMQVHKIPYPSGVLQRKRICFSPQASGTCEIEARGVGRAVIITKHHVTPW